MGAQSSGKKRQGIPANTLARCSQICHGYCTPAFPVTPRDISINTGEGYLEVSVNTAPIGGAEAGAGARTVFIHLFACRYWIAVSNHEIR